MSLSTRKLGHQGLEVPTLGLGWMGMSQSYGPADDDESIAVLHHALELGCNFFDTAEVYGPFRNEELLGRALRGRLPSAIIATNFGFDIQQGNPSLAVTNSRPEHIRGPVVRSLRAPNSALDRQR